MVKQIDKNEARLRRHRRVRNKISGTAALLKAKKISALRDAIQKIEFSLKGSKGRLPSR